jgi:hypothetical protein
MQHVDSKSVCYEICGFHYHYGKLVSRKGEGSKINPNPNTPLTVENMGALTAEQKGDTLMNSQLQWV